MPAVQTNYNHRIGIAVNGEIASAHPTEADTYVVDHGDGIGWGIACKLETPGDGEVEPQCSPGVALGNFVGVTVKDPTRQPDDEDKYRDGANASLLTKGDIWVKVEANESVTAGADVTVKASTGELSSRAAAGGQLRIVGARWMTKTPADGGLAVLRLTGDLGLSAAVEA